MARKTLDKKQTAAKIAKFKTTMAAKRTAEMRAAGYTKPEPTSFPLDAIPAKKPPVKKFTGPLTKTIQDRAFDLIETGLLLLKGMHK